MQQMKSCSIQNNTRLTLKMGEKNERTWNVKQMFLMELKLYITDVKLLCIITETFYKRLHNNVQSCLLGYTAV
jgi:hypothetical protein